MKEVFTKMHINGSEKFKLTFYVFVYVFPDKHQILKISITLQCQLVEPFAFWNLAHEGSTLWICLDYCSFWAIQKYNSQFRVSVVATLKALLLHLPNFTSFAHRPLSKGANPVQSVSQHFTPHNMCSYLGISIKRLDLAEMISRNISSGYNISLFYD